MKLINLDFDYVNIDISDHASLEYDFDKIIKYLSDENNNKSTPIYSIKNTVHFLSTVTNFIKKEFDKIDFQNNTTEKYLLFQEVCGSSDTETLVNIAKNLSEILNKILIHKQITAKEAAILKDFLIKFILIIDSNNDLFFKNGSYVC